MAGYQLSVDFGTASTVAILAAPDGSRRTLLFDGDDQLPSATCLDNAPHLLVGRDALALGQAHPDRLAAYPKRAVELGTVVLGGVECSVGDLFAAVFARVAAEARRVAGAPMTAVILTHPASWDRRRQATLSRAAAKVGLGPIRLVAEPVAAAGHAVEAGIMPVPVGSSLLVYDLGAGTFDAAVVRRRDTTFEVLSHRTVADVGGLACDAAVIGHLGDLLADDTIRWERLTRPQTIEDRRAARIFHDEVRDAKELLSRADATTVMVPVFNEGVALERAQFEELIRPLIERTVTATVSTVHEAGVAPSRLAGVLLVGGSSRIPLATRLLGDALGVVPTAIKRPRMAFAEGCLPARPRPAGAPEPDAPRVASTPPPRNAGPRTGVPATAAAAPAGAVPAGAGAGRNTGPSTAPGRNTGPSTAPRTAAAGAAAAGDTAGAGAARAAAAAGAAAARAAAARAAVAGSAAVSTGAAPASSGHAAASSPPPSGAASAAGGRGSGQRSVAEARAAGAAAARAAMAGRSAVPAGAPAAGGAAGAAARQATRVESGGGPGEPRAAAAPAPAVTPGVLLEPDTPSAEHVPWVVPGGPSPTQAAAGTAWAAGWGSAAEPDTALEPHVGEIVDWQVPYPADPRAVAVRRAGDVATAPVPVGWAAPAAGALTIRAAVPPAPPETVLEVELAGPAPRTRRPSGWAGAYRMPWRRRAGRESPPETSAFETPPEFRSVAEPINATTRMVRRRDPAGTARVIAGTTVGALVAGAAGVWVALAVTGSAASTRIEVGDCVRQDGAVARRVDCADAGAFTVVSKVVPAGGCPDPAQPYAMEAGTQLCLAPRH